MDSGGEVPGLMAETLIVLTGENAWSAARSFGSESVRDGDLTGARYWRGVARAVLRNYAARLFDSAEESVTAHAAPAAPEPHAEMTEATAASEAPAEMREAPATEPEIASAGPDSAASGNNLGHGPIPLRARRHSSWRAAAGIEAEAGDAAAPAPMDVARAA